MGANRATRRKVGKGRARAKRKARLAQQYGLPDGATIEDMDAMHAEALKRYGVGIGVVVQEEQRHQRNEDSHAAERAAITGGQRFMQALWPWSRYRVLGRMERRERAGRQEWAERLRVVARAVAERTGER